MVIGNHLTGSRLHGLLTLVVPFWFPAMEPTSPSSPSSPEAEVVEITSPSEAHSPPPPSTRGRGRGRSRGHGRGRSTAASSSSRPQPQAAMSKPKGSKRKSASLPWLRQEPDPNDPMVETSVSDGSEETDRIAAATKKTLSWSADAGESTSADEMSTAPATSHSQSLPKTSGLFDYATWVVEGLTSEQRQKLTSKFTWIDLCAGLGTPLIVYEALRRALLPYDLRPAGECTGMTEMNDNKRAALRRRAQHLSHDAPIFKSNEALGSRTPKDDRDTVRDIPIGKFLFLGIVCVDISGCSTTPKSLEDICGATGKSWLHFLAYLDKLNSEERPIALKLECVDKLSHHRNVDDRIEKGTILVIDALKERGYVGQWRKVSATNFFLPQRRPRVWGLFLKLLGGVGPKAIQRRQEDVAKAFRLIQRFQTPSHEPIRKILARSPIPYAHRPVQQRKGKTGWRTTQGPNFQAKHGLSDEEVRQGQEEFDQITSEVLAPRKQAAVWLKLCLLRKQGRIPNWKVGTFVSDCGSSVAWVSVVKDMFPCIRPGNSYLVLEDGVPKLASGPTCLAMQGIGSDEAESAGLLLEEDALLRDLAGNAFCANICLVFLVAALLS